MTTTIQYFGMLAEHIGKSGETINFQTENDVIELNSFFESKYPVLKNLTYKIAVNQELTENTTLNEIPKEIALLPPFAGG